MATEPQISAEPERQRCASYLLSLFPEPVPCDSVRKSEFFGFVDCVLQSRLQCERHITGEAQIFDDLEENVCGYRFNCEGFPGPPKASQNWHLWAHATTRKGACGILAVGKVLPTDHSVAGLDPSEDTFSFFGRSMNAPQWNEGVVALACKCYRSTKNCSGIVFAGLLPCAHAKGKRADVAYENNLSKFHALVHSISTDRRWAIRLTAARIDYIFVLSDRSKADYPPDETKRRVKRQKALSLSPQLALQDGTLDESWGRQIPRPSPIRQNPRCPPISNRRNLKISWQLQAPSFKFDDQCLRSKHLTLLSGSFVFADASMFYFLQFQLAWFQA